MYLKEKNVDPNTQNYKTDLHKRIIFLIYKVTEINERNLQRQTQR